MPATLNLAPCYPVPIMLPEPFIQQIKTRFGAEADSFLQALQQPAPISLRLNPNKRPSEPLFADSEAILWHKSGRYLSERPVFALDPCWHAGAYYVQEASSMVVAEVVRQALGARVSTPLAALDFCAAPGGKTTLLLDTLSSDALVVANEVIKSRVGPLSENLERWGKANIAVTSAEVEQFAPLAGQFDLILADAPCSGEGMFRKDPDAAKEWSLENVAICTARQQRIVSGLIPLLAPGGVLIYSTCTYNPHENDENVQFMMRQFGLELVPIQLPAQFGFMQTQTGQAAYPHRVRGEGFFIAALRKPDAAETPKKPAKPLEMKRLVRADKKTIEGSNPWLRDPASADFWLTKHGTIRHLPVFAAEDGAKNQSRLQQIIVLLEHHIQYCIVGRTFGEVKGKDLIPDHALAMSIDLLAPQTLEISLTEALAFLRKQDVEFTGNVGWNCMQYQGLALGWAKLLPNRVNNYLPMERRLRMA
jgi:16S rRNA C967 or C1407 C5-methylase (RsmB/RsmF family)/NOL1/NOP2/fmu family ribosome biogenesis protein